jgi:FHA domain
MPKMTVLLGRRAVQVHDLELTTIKVGRDEEMDIVIDNPSVSRKHVAFRSDGTGWVVEDMGSSNGTFLRGEKLDGAQPVEAGDEIGIGKFSIVFDKVVADAPAPSSAGPKLRPTMAGVEGTTHIKPHEVKEILQDSARKRRAHIVWESGGQRGTHYLSETPAALVGTDDLCDVRVPKGPKHHILVVSKDSGCEVRNLHAWTKMKVNGAARGRAGLKDGDVVEIGGLKITFVADIN